MNRWIITVSMLFGIMTTSGIAIWSAEAWVRSEVKTQISLEVSVRLGRIEEQLTWIRRSLVDIRQEVRANGR